MRVNSIKNYVFLFVFGFIALGLVGLMSCGIQVEDVEEDKNKEGSDSFDIVFNITDGEKTNVVKRTVRKEVSSEELEKIMNDFISSRENHFFEGWYSDETLTTKIIISELAESDFFKMRNGRVHRRAMKVYGRWLPKPEITFSLFDTAKDSITGKGYFRKLGSHSIISDPKAKISKEKISDVESQFVASKPNNVDFDGWYLSRDFKGTKVDINSFTVGTKNVELYGRYKIKSYTVTFQVNGGSVVASQTKSHGSKVSKPTAPTRAGHTFADWFKEAGFTSQFNFTTEEITANRTIYAKWYVNPIITFQVNGGSAVANQTITYDTKVSKPTAPTRAGHTFGGWFKEAGFTTKFNFTTEKITANTTIYAKWHKNPTITFQVNGGSAVANQTIAYNTKVTEPTAPTRAGHTFGGWFKEAGFTTKFNFTTEKITANTTIYAKWHKNPTITFQVNGGSAVATRTITYNTKVTKPNDPTRAGNTFAGWFKEVGLTTQFNFSTENVTADTTLYASWTANPRTVSFNVNGGSAIANAIVAHGGKLSKPTDPTKAGLNFEGWYKDNSLTTAFNFENSGMSVESITGNLTLYAKWSAVVTFDSKSGSAVASATLNPGATVTKPTNPTKNSNGALRFGGWYTDAGLTTAFNFATRVQQNTTLYAKWECRVSFHSYNRWDGRVDQRNVSATVYVTEGKTVSRPTTTPTAGHKTGGGGIHFWAASGDRHNPPSAARGWFKGTSVRGNPPPQ